MAQSEKEMKTQILEALKSSESRCVTITELQEIVIGDNEGMKKKFLSILDEMALGKKLSVDGENVTKLSKRRRDDVDPNKPIAKGERDEHGNLKQNKAAKYEPKVVPNERVEFNPSELWKNGEQVYRESLMVKDRLQLSHFERYFLKIDLSSLTYRARSIFEPTLIISLDCSLEI